MRRLLWLGAELIGLLLLAMITGFEPLYWIVYLVVGGIIFSYLWVWLQSRGLETRIRELSLHPQVGGTVQLAVEVKEKSGLPRMGLRSRLSGDLIRMETDVEYNLSPKGTVTWTVSGLCQRRGLNSVGSIAMASSDPTGLLNLRCHVGDPQQILVYPATVELSQAVVRGQASGGELGETGLLTGHSPAASMVRDYVPGDSLAHIHWPSTARRDQLMTKEYEGAGVNEIWLFVDLQQSVQSGEGQDGTEEWLITIAASLAKGLIAYEHAVGLVTHGDQTYRFPPAKDTNHLWGMMKALATIRAEGRTPLSSLMSQHSADMSAGTVAIVIAPWSNQSLGSLFRFMARRRILVAPIFLDKSSFGMGASQAFRDPWLELSEWTSVVKRGDDLSPVLGNLINRIASY
jgi:uncharacterized protein (DUF58 family)